MNIISGKGPEKFSVEVLYFDDDEKNKLNDSVAAKSIMRIANNIIEISTAEFLTYYLFNLKRTLRPPPTLESLNTSIWRASRELDGYVDFNDASICTAQGVDHQRNEITERIGEAIGLTVINRIHDLTEADWNPIPLQPGRRGKKTLDYELASNGNLHIQVENKGSSVIDNRERPATIYNHASSIREKKNKSPTVVASGVRYGTLSVIDPRIDSTIKCYLLDPAPDSILRNSYQTQLLSRMRFLQGWISFLSPNSQLAAALSSRLLALESSRDFSDLDGAPLLRGNGIEFEIEGMFGNSSPFFNTKSKIVDGPTGGVCLQLSDDYLFFVGIMEELLFQSAKQNFSIIREYSRNPGSIRKKVDCMFSQGRFEDLKLPSDLKKSARKSGGYYTFQLEGKMHYSRAGLVFGFLPLTRYL